MNRRDRGVAVKHSKFLEEVIFSMRGGVMHESTRVTSIKR